tara:strand:+ start:693 stop:815 length:123 start_codon:yes stop_codon:yes gene_type:complete
MFRKNLFWAFAPAQKPQKILQEHLLNFEVTFGWAKPTNQK